MDNLALKKKFEQNSQTIGLNFENIIIKGIDLESNIIGKCKFQNVIFIEEYITMVYENTFENCLFIDCDFYKGDFQRNIFRNCIFKNCSFRKGGMAGYEIEGCIFAGCDFTWGEIESCSISSTVFKACILNEVFFKKHNEISNVIFEEIKAPEE